MSYRTPLLTPEAEVTLAAAIEKSRSIAEVLYHLKVAKVGSNYHMVRKEAARLHLSIEHLSGQQYGCRLRGAPLDEYLVIASPLSRGALRKRLIRERRLPPGCAVCGLHDWHGRPIALQLDHINGVRDDARLDNLRFICPNCHSQTSTYAGRNRRRGSGLARRPNYEMVELVCPTCELPFKRSPAYVAAKKLQGSQTYCSRRCAGKANTALADAHSGGRPSRTLVYLDLLEKTPGLSINRAAALMGVHRTNISYWKRQLRRAGRLPPLTPVGM